MEEESCLVPSNGVTLLNYNKTKHVENDDRNIPHEQEIMNENEKSVVTATTERTECPNNDANEADSKADISTPTLESERVDPAKKNINRVNVKDAHLYDEIEEEKETDYTVEEGLEEMQIRDKRVTSQETATPPDGGWGWVVLAGSFVVMLLISSIGPCFSLVFSPLLLDLGTSPTTSFWIFGTFSLIWNLVSPAIGPLTEEFGHRRVAVVGSLLATVGVTASAFASSSLYLFLSYSLLGGVGAGVLVTISTLIIPVYFSKRRGLANGIFMTGTSIGLFAAPHLITLLQGYYAYRGAILILGAILLNTLVSAAVFLPLQGHSKTRRYQGQCASRVDLQLHRSRTDEENNCLVQQNQPPVAVAKTPIQKQRDEKSVGICRILFRVSRSTLLSLKILCSPPAFIIALSGTLTMNGYLAFVMMVPLVVKDLHSAQGSALCVSVAGICNLLSRLVMSAMTDCGWFDMRCGYIISFLIIAVSNIAFPFLTSLTWMAVAMGAWGYGIGSFMGLYNLVMIKYMGVKNLPAMFGSACVLNGLGFISIGPLLGWVREVTGSFSISIWTLASIEFLCIFLWLLMPAAVSWQDRKSVFPSPVPV